MRSGFLNFLEVIDGAEDAAPGRDGEEVAGAGGFQQMLQAARRPIRTELRWMGQWQVPETGWPLSEDVLQQELGESRVFYIIQLNEEASWGERQTDRQEGANEELSTKEETGGERSPRRKAHPRY